MAKNYSRRDFIKSTLLGSGALFIAISPLKSFAKSQDNTKQNVNKSGIDAIALNAQAKQLFFQKKYAEATAIYQQLITLYPAKINYYDGYARVLGAQQKTLEVAELYREGLKNNPKKAVFMHRLSLRIQDLCTGNRKAEMAFVSKYGDALLFETATQLMLDAISLNKKNKGLYLNLRDIIKTAEAKNNWLVKRSLPVINFSETTKSHIKSISSSFEQTWSKDRIKHKPLMPTDIDAGVSKLKNKNRRDLFTLKEKTQRDALTKKTRKGHWKLALENHIAAKNINKVEKYGLLVLGEQIDDTDTIGKLRKFYKNRKAHDRLVSLNRYLYINHETIPNTLALANSLVFHADSSSATSESITLLDKIKDYVDTLHPAAIAGYYLTRSGALIKNGQRADARSCLMDGIRKFDGRGGAAYSMLEAYALSFAGDNLTKGETILKALCGQSVTPIDDDVWMYVDLHLNNRKQNGKQLSVMEQIKQYNALCKVQKKTGSAEYGVTSAKVAALKASLHKS